MNETYIIIVGGGVGKRMEAGQPKQFLPLNGKTILQHTLEAFHASDPTFKYIVVLPESSIDFWKSHVKIKKISIPHIVVEGGKERFHSVRNALASINGKGIVAIHDAVRPFVSKQTLKNCFEGVKKSGNAVPVIEVSDSIRIITSSGSDMVNRTLVKRVQTPQCFLLPEIKKAYEQEYNPKFTDDASVAEAMGMKINLVEGNPENIKITTPFDMQLAESFFK
jgi:2-C-methyl-D-erythritol 4-phosphate cytidylyltransferase